MRKDVVGGPSIVFSKKNVVDMTVFRCSTNCCKKFVSFDSSQLFPDSVCQAMSAGLNTNWELVLEPCKLKLQQSRSKKFKKQDHVIR